jgi:hypothetical protein
MNGNMNGKYTSSMQDYSGMNGKCTSMESRLFQLESNHKSVKQGFDSIATHLKELGRKLLDQPSMTAYAGNDAATSNNFRMLAQRLREIGDVFQDMPSASISHSSAGMFSSGSIQSFPEYNKPGANADDFARNWDERLRCVEDRVSEKLRNVDNRMSERFRNMEDGVAESFRILEDRSMKYEHKMMDMEAGMAQAFQSANMKFDYPMDSNMKYNYPNTASSYFTNTMDANYKDSRSYMEGKPNAIENVRLPDAMNNSYNEYTSNQRNWHPLARNYNEHATNKGMKTPFDEWRETTGRLDSPRNGRNNAHTWDGPFSSTNLNSDPSGMTSAMMPRPPSRPQSRPGSPQSPAFHRRFDHSGMNGMSGSPTDFQRRLDQMNTSNTASPYRRRSPERS